MVIKHIDSLSASACDLMSACNPDISINFGSNSRKKRSAQAYIYGDFIVSIKKANKKTNSELTSKSEISIEKKHENF
jgi:hypothetical protein